MDIENPNQPRYKNKPREIFQCCGSQIVEGLKIVYSLETERRILKKVSIVQQAKVHTKYKPLKFHIEGDMLFQTKYENEG